MSWGQDFRFAFRMIQKKPWFSAAIVGTLALGMGINTTVFSLVNAVLFKPLPFPGGERLVMATASQPSARREFVSVSLADFMDFRQSAQSFERLEAMNPTAITLGERGNPPERYRGAFVTAGLFEMLRTKPVLGRGFQESDQRPGAEPVVLLGHGVWKDRYGQDPKVIGRVVRANEKPATIIGVMPEGLKFPQREDLWMAIVPDKDAADRTKRRFTMVGMLKEGTSIAEARADMSMLAKRLEKEYPASNKDHEASVRTFHEAMNGGQIRIVFLLMLGAVGFVLLIACANVANMLLTRAVERMREISIRAAMGASRWRIVRQLLIESVMLSTAGGVAGLLIARYGTRAFDLAVSDVGKPYWIDFSMNYVVFGYFAALTILAGIIFGLAPALSASRIDLNDTLKEGARGSAGGRGGLLSGALVVFQFVLALVLLSGAGLMVRSFFVAQSEFAEMKGDQVLTARVTLPEDRYPKAEDKQRFFENLLSRLSAIPGAQTVAMTSNTPGAGAAGRRFEIAGQPILEAEKRPAASVVVASPGYLRLVKRSLAQGRDFNEDDGLPGKEAVIVSRAFASKFFPNQNPLAKQVRLFDDAKKPRPWMTIVGVTPDMRQGNPSEANDPVVFVPYRFESYSGMALMVRALGSPGALTMSVRTVVQELDQDLPLFDARTLQENFDRQRWFLSVFGTLFMIFAMVALGMAAVGIYAVMSHAAIRRTREIGVRMALGAGVGSIVRLVLGRGVKQLALAMVLGIAAAIGVCQLMAGLLFQVAPNDPLTFVVVAVTLGAAGLIATWLPAMRAARLDPVRALRHD